MSEAHSVGEDSWGPGILTSKLLGLRPLVGGNTGPGVHILPRLGEKLEIWVCGFES